MDYAGGAITGNCGDRTVNQRTPLASVGKARASGLNWPCNWTVLLGGTGTFVQKVTVGFPKPSTRAGLLQNGVFPVIYRSGILSLT